MANVQWRKFNRKSTFDMMLKLHRNDII